MAAVDAVVDYMLGWVARSPNTRRGYFSIGLDDDVFSAEGRDDKILFAGFFWGFADRVVSHDALLFVH
jgi:hypothetical protein